MVTNSLRWTNKNSAAVVDRAAPLLVTWLGGSPSGYVVFGGQSLGGGSDLDNAASARMFACVEQAGKERLTVPAHVLRALPPSASGGGFLFLAEHPLQVPFTAPGLDAGYIMNLNTDYREAELR